MPCWSLVTLDVVIGIVWLFLFYITFILIVAEPKPKERTLLWIFFNKSMFQFYGVNALFFLVVYFLTKYIMNTCW